jgi:hypothetical protein
MNFFKTLFTSNNQRLTPKESSSQKRLQRLMVNTSGRMGATSRTPLKNSQPKYLKKETTKMTQKELQTAIRALPNKLVEFNSMKMMT